MKNSCDKIFITGFPPIVREDAQVLVLGSMPGAASLAAGEYYAHPQNAFWPVMREIFGAADFQNYEEKTALLLENRIALWDVFKHCAREGSLDSAIKNGALNDFAAFFSAYPQVTHVFFNGKKAEKEFLKYARPVLPRQDIVFHGLPSTSPAMAMMTRAEKTAAWQVVATALRATP